MQTETLFCLQRRWRQVSAVWLLIWLMFYAWLKPVWPDWATQWAVVALFPLLYGLGVLWQGLPLNHRAGERELLPALGWGNQLTLLRGLAVGLLAGFLLAPWPEGALAWVPVLLYTIADIADYLDGYVARITHHVTLLGARLDMEFDGLGMVVVSLLAVWYGQLPWWYLGLGLARYLFVAGLAWRKRRGLPVYEMSPSVHRRIFAGFQMGFMSAVLWPIVPPVAATIAGTLFAIPTALGFLRDWLVVIGWLRPNSAVYQSTQRTLFILTTRYLPPFLRLGVGVLLPALLLALTPRLPMLFTTWQLPLAAGLAAGIVGVGWVAGTAVLLGVIGRLFAFLLVFPVGFHMLIAGATWQNSLVLTCIICIMLLSGGAFSLWQPEEPYMVRRAGDGV